MRAFIAVALLGLAAGAAAQALPEPTPAPDAGPRTFHLNLDRLVDLDQERGHAEFDRSLLQEMWRDPMVRLEWGVAREEWATRRGGLVGGGVPWSATVNLAFQPGLSPRLIFSGPWATDWHDLTPQEKIGRLAEDAAYAAIIIAMLHSLR